MVCTNLSKSGSYLLPNACRQSGLLIWEMTKAWPSKRSTSGVSGTLYFACLQQRSPQYIFLTVEFWDGNMLDGFAWLPWCLWFGGIFRGWIKCQLMMLIIVVNRLSQMKIWCMWVFKNFLANIVRGIVSPKSSCTRISLEFPLFIFDHNRYFYKEKSFLIFYHNRYERRKKVGSWPQLWEKSNFVKNKNVK